MIVFVARKKFKLAFTLAEVLITLGIIGIVAAMTMPVLIGRYREKVTVTQLKKVNSVLNQAFIMATEKYGPIENWDLGTIGLADPDGANTLMVRFAEFLNKTKTCRAEQTGCLPDVKYKCLNGEEYYLNIDTSGQYSRIRLTDGTIISFYIYNNTCSENWGITKPLQNVCGAILADINGNKLPNQFGVDFFTFLITKHGIVPQGTQMQTKGFTFDRACKDKSIGSIPGLGANGAGCAAWVIYNENMDYLHCSDLSWESKTKCGK